MPGQNARVGLLAETSGGSPGWARPARMGVPESLYARWEGAAQTGSGQGSPLLVGEGRGGAEQKMRFGGGNGAAVRLPLGTRVCE